MFVGRYRINRHAAQRMAQRNLVPGDLAAVLCLGRTEHRAGARFFFPGGRDVPEHLGSALETLVGTTVVVEGDEITTVYRNRRALTRIKRKHKWHRARRNHPRAGVFA